MGDIILVEGDNQLNIQMVPIVGVARLYGIITDDTTGIPVVGANITIYQDYDTKTKSWNIFTDQYGFYEAVDMIPGVSADMVIYAGGYKTFTRTGIPIAEGDNELNVVLTWKGGPRDVPRFIDYSIFLVAGQEWPIVSGLEFPFSLTVWLPYQEYLFRCYLNISHREERDNLTMGSTSLLPASLWDRLSQEWQDYYTEQGWIRFTTAGEYTVEGTERAVWTYKRGVSWYKDVPLLPWTYDVKYWIYRQVVEVNAKGGLAYYSETAEGHYEAGGIVGTVEVIHPIGYGGLRGTVTDAGTGEPLGYVKVASANVSDRTNAQGEYRLTYMSPTYSDFTVEFSKFGYETVTRNFRLNQGWNEINIQMSPL